MAMLVYRSVRSDLKKINQKRVKIESPRNTHESSPPNMDLEWNLGNQNPPKKQQQNNNHQRSPYYQPKPLYTLNNYQKIFASTLINPKKNRSHVSWTPRFFFSDNDSPPDCQKSSLVVVGVSAHRSW